MTLPARSALLAILSTVTLLLGSRLLQPPPRLGPPSPIGSLFPPLDPNCASLEELTALPEIGPALAARIVTARPFASPSNLTRVPGIGRHRLAALIPRIRIAADCPQGARPE